MRRSRDIITTTLLLGLCPALVQAAGDAAGIELFEKRIRPVLIEHCYKCHSADSKVLEAGLRVDTRAGIRKGGDSGAAVVPGKIDKSLIISALEHDDFEMPPEKKLPKEVIADFRRWIELGAPDPREGEATVAAPAEIDIEEGKSFWSFQLPKQHAVPAVKQTDWARNDIDRFVLSKLEGAGLKPAPDADRETLIRRVSFALVGLPPKPDAIDAFVADKSPDALAKVVDRLLASPRFGERWARHWLDIARYAESSGGGRTLVYPNAWRYRDYVIRSFNADKPFDHFIKEQIAGDLMPHDSLVAKRERLTATGFLALGPTNFELQDKELLRMEVIDEQLDTIGRSMLGMTVGCARCHDHKFDPIPTRDYYAMAGIFGSVKSFNLGNVASPVRVAIASPEEEKKLAAYRDKIRDFDKQIGELDKRYKQLVAIAASKKPGKDNLTSQTPPASRVDLAKLPGVVVDNTKAKLVGSWKRSTFTRGFLGSEYVHDENAGKGSKSITFAARLPRDGVYDVRVSYTPGTNRARQVPVTVRHADGETTAKVNQAVAPPISGLFASVGTYRFTASKEAAVEIANAGTKEYVIADAVQFVPQPGAESNDQPKNTKAESGTQVSTKNRGTVAAVKKEIPKLKKQLDALRKERDRLKKKAPKASDQVLSVVEDKPRDGYLHIRGGVRNRGPLVPRGVLQVTLYDPAPEIPQDESGRLQMAEWIASDKNPLTARVMANRVWHHLIGEGLVRTPDNFGTMGERPSHPELLDHLALRFVEHGWSVKKLIREIILTRTYQQSSTPSDAAEKLDPENRLLSHAHRRRLDAEAIRDAMLAVSGKLDLTAFGPTMKPKTKSELGYKFASLRRSIYVPSFRNTQLDMLSAFDAANPNVVTGRRVPSTLPTQALLMMNSPTVIDQSRAAAERLIADTPRADDAARLKLLYRRALGRQPRSSELERLEAYLATQKQEEGKPPSGNAWARVCQTVFACVDFRYVY